MLEFIDVTEDMLITTGRKSKSHTNYLLLGYTSCCTLTDECTCEVEVLMLKKMVCTI